MVAMEPRQPAQGTQPPPRTGELPPTNHFLFCFLVMADKMCFLVGVLSVWYLRHPALDLLGFYLGLPLEYCGAFPQLFGCENFVFG